MAVIKKFYSLHSELCIGSYVSMHDPKYVSNNEIRRCQKNYFSDYKEKIIPFNLKLNFKFASDCKISEIEGIEDLDSQPVTITYRNNDIDKFISCY